MDTPRKNRIAVLCTLGGAAWIMACTAPTRSATITSHVGTTHAATALAPDVVGFRGPHRDGNFDGKVPHRRPDVAWTFRTDGPIRSSPIWVDRLVIFGSGDGNLYAVEAANGAERWRFHTGGGVDGAADFAAGNVVVESRDGNLYAVDVRTGQESWRVALGADLPSEWDFEFFLSSPVVDGARIFAGSGNGDVLAIDATNGHVVWRHPTAGHVRGSPSVFEGLVYVGSFDGYVYALDQKSGAEIWKFATQGAGIDLKAAGFDRRSVQSSPAVTQDLVVVGCRDARMYAIDRHTGLERWNVDNEMSWIVSSPAIAAGKAIAGTSDGRFVQAVDLATGKETWRTRTDSNSQASPAVAGDVVVTGDSLGSVLALDLATGRELWRVATGEAVYSSPLVRDGHVYVGSDDGKLYALSGDLAAPARRAYRAVYYDRIVSYRYFQGDRDLRTVLTAESYQTLTRFNVAQFLEARIADRAPSVVVFATDAIPTTLVDDADGKSTLLRRYLEAGGKAVWPGGPPLLVVFDPVSGQVVQPTPESVKRFRGVLGIDENGSFEGPSRSRPTDLGRRWGLSADWWMCEAPIAPAAGAVDVLATDEHGHAAAWVRHYGGAPGTGFVRCWGREKPLPDPRVVLKLAEYELP
jgi:outer membrane protein assembly factor BamB